ncbi:MAG: enoyl-CoA hydratase/isomerase family protein [Halioglobus sp.]
MLVEEHNWEFLQVERKGRVLTVRFDGGNKVNALSNALMRELIALPQMLEDDAELSAVVLMGQDSIFSGGMDLKDPDNVRVRDMTVAQRRKLVQLGPRMCAAWEAIEPVTIAAIEGWCVGGGMALISACDWRVASTQTQLYVPELRLGMNMSWQSVPRFVSLIGPAKTKQLLILAEPLDASTAHQWGLVDYLAEPGNCYAMAMELADKVAAMPPIPVRMAKQGINKAANALNDATSFMDADQFLLAQATEDAVEGPRAFFEKRAPKFEGN